MADLALLDHQLDVQASTCRAIVGLSHGDGAPEADVLVATAIDLTSWLPDRAPFSLEVGFIPSTQTGDGAPLTVLVLGDRSSSMEAVATVRLIGVLEADRSEKGNTFSSGVIVAVAQASATFQRLKDRDGLGDDLLEMLTKAWVDYNMLRYATFQIVALTAPAQAAILIDQFSLRGRSWQGRRAG
jgi:inorganic pyrophosphatase